MINNSSISRRRRNTWKISGSVIATLMISNEEIYGIMKIVKSLEDSGLLIKGVSETIQNEVKE